MNALNIFYLIILVCILPFLAGALILSILTFFDYSDAPEKLNSDLEDNDIEFL